jgi:hypothetical protein
MNRAKSAYGTKRTSQSRLPMSAFGGKADITAAQRNVCFPKADIAKRCFDHLQAAGLSRYDASL